MLSIKVLNRAGATVCAAHGEWEVILPVCHTYEEGDRIVIETETKNCFMVIQPDDAMGESMVYVTGNIDFKVPYGEKKICYSPKSFSGERHLITARYAMKEEIESYRNLTVNRMDQGGLENCYPHASANVETRGESVFAARNAIDGVKANLSHGEWPYGSWGINRDPNAVIRIDFGRTVELDRLVMYLRADFPHDNWWKSVTIRFDDDTTMEWMLEKTNQGQSCSIAPRKTAWIQMEQMIQSEEPSPFPALTQLEAYGREL